MIDSCGYYEVAGRRHYNKFQAYADAFGIRETPHWNFHEHLFSLHDWTQEPVTSLRELYRDRALQIRNSADYVIVMFSGGADSWTVVNSFVTNDILIDEIWTMAPVEWRQTWDNSLSPYNAANEVRFAAIPEAKKFLSRSPKTKFRVIESGELMIDFWSRNTLDPESHNHFAAEAPIRNYASDFFSPSIPKHAHKVRIVGIDKPRLFYQGGRFYLYFFDTIAWSRLGDRSRADSLDYDMAFYWHPESIQLLAKQAHTIKRWFKHNPQYLSLLNLEHQTEQYQAIVNSLVYPDYDTGIWQTPKNRGLWDFEIYQPFSANLSSRATQNWRQSIGKYSDAIYDMFRDHDRLADKHVTLTEYGWYRSLPGCYSKFYDLGE